MTTSFARVDYPTQHAGVMRVERAVEFFRTATRSFEGARGAAALLLAAIVSAVLVVAHQVIDTWTDGHLLAAWIALWTVAFAALALLAVPARNTARSLRSSWRAAAQRRRDRREDRRLWEVALTDARVMADLSRAMSSAAAQNARAAG